MAIQQDYAKLTVFYDSTYLTQLTSVSLETDSGQQPVMLLNEGLGGYVSGAGDVKIKLGFAVPIGGTEMPFQQDAATGRYVEMQIGVGPVGYIGRGKVMNVSISQSVNGATEGTLDWTGGLKPME